MFVIGSRKIVRLEWDNMFNFSTKPAVHTGLAGALKESERLAAKHPDSEFVVFKAVSITKVTNPPIQTQIL